MDNSRTDARKEPEIVYSRTIKAGKRIYYIDVKQARNDDYYVCITESKKKQGAEDQQPSFEKHKLFLYKEDFAHFMEGLEDVIGYVTDQVGEIEPRQERVDQPASDAEEPTAPEEQELEKHRFGFFGFRK